MGLCVGDMTLMITTASQLGCMGVRGETRQTASINTTSHNFVNIKGQALSGANSNILLFV